MGATSVWYELRGRVFLYCEKRERESNRERENDREPHQMQHLDEFSVRAHVLNIDIHSTNPYNFNAKTVAHMNKLDKQQGKKKNDELIYHKKWKQPFFYIPMP